MKKINFNIKIFHLFLIFIKKFNIKWLPVYYNSFNLKFYNKKWLRQFVYIFHLKSLNMNLSYFFNDQFFSKDYYLLYLFESFEKFNSIFRKSSQFFCFEENKVIPYVKFKFRIPWFFYISTGPYIEYFRYFLYLDYIKGVPISPEMKHFICHRVHRHISLTRQHSISLSNDRYIFFELNRDATFLNVNNVFYSVHSVKKYINFFWQYIFCLSNSAFQKYFKFWNHFFYLPLTILCYKFIWLFVRQLQIYNKFRNLTPSSLFITLSYLRFDYSKWIVIYSLRKMFLKFNLWESCYYPVVQKDSWLNILEVCLFEIFNRLHFHRLLNQFDREQNYLITPLFLILWEVFIEFYYFELTSIESYYNTFAEFTYWSSLFKFTLENLLYDIYNHSIHKLKSKLIFQQYNMYLYNQKYFFNYLFKVVYKRYFFNLKLNKGKNIFYLQQFESFLLRYYFEKNNTNDYYLLFKYNQFKERRLFLYKFVHVYKFNLFYRWNERNIFCFPYSPGIWKKTKRKIDHIYYVI